jgi:hypothetical protein
MQIDYAEVEKLSGRRLNDKQICAILGYDLLQYQKQIDADPLLKASIEKGIAVALNTAAQVVENAYTATGTVFLKEQEEFKLKAALEFLERHSPSWRKASR